jgi:SAM-dependent methyltransferase
MPPTSEFDGFADNYDQALQNGLSLSGERKDFFANGRVNILARLLVARPFPRILDYGCGTGSATPYLHAMPNVSAVIGVDISDKSLDRARATYRQPHVEFHNLSTLSQLGSFDLAFCNGVFHHIPISERSEAVNQIYHALNPNGLFAFWENNPWNPGTHWVMSRIPFDRDAIMLWPNAARRLLSGAGFEVVLTHFAFIFPKALRFLRFAEWPLRHLPFGAQYMLLARKKSSL